MPAHAPSAFAIRLWQCALLLHLPARGAAEAVGSCGGYAAVTRPPRPQRATRQGNDVHDPARELHVVRNSDQDRTLGGTGDKAESFAEMIIGCRGAIDSAGILIVGRLGTKIIKRKDLHQPSVSGWTILEWPSHGQTRLGVTQPRRCEHDAAPKLITGLGHIGDSGDV